MKKIIGLLLFTFLLFGCGKKEELSYKEIMASQEYIIVDVRTKEEYSEKHIKDAINIPVTQIEETTNLDKNKTIFVYCRSGNRSKTAYEKLKNLGYSVYDLGAFSNIDLPKE